MYYAKHTQEDVRTELVATIEGVNALVEHFGWEDCEWELWESSNGVYSKMEFPCHYYGDYTCEHTSNRPDSLCPFHAGEED